MLRILFAFLFLAASATAQDAVMYGSGDLVGGRFVLKSINGKEIDAPAPMVFEWPSSGEMSGRICNAFRGKCIFLNNLVKVEDLASTRMMCPDPELAELEGKIHASLRNGMSFVVYGKTLEMRRDDLFILLERDGNAERTESAAPNGGTDDAAEKDATPPPPSGTEAASVTPTDGGTGEVRREDLVGRKFVLSSVDGEDFIVGMGLRPFIQFNDDFRISGSACNNFMGGGELENGMLRMTRGASTMMLCIDENLARYERDFLRMMSEGADISLADDALTLRGDGKTHLFIEEK